MTTYTHWHGAPIQLASCPLQLFVTVVQDQLQSALAPQLTPLHYSHRFTASMQKEEVLRMLYSGFTLEVYMHGEGVYTMHADIFPFSSVLPAGQVGCINYRAHTESARWLFQIFRDSRLMECQHHACIHQIQ